MFSFAKTTPEYVNIPSSSIKKVLERLDEKEIPMHSLLIMRDDKLVFEKYYAPYKADTLHRLFSISKTMTGVAISLLVDEGRISMDDPITDYFPEYVTEDVHPWIKATTIRNMLQMRTCHAASTYKVDMKSNWVESFFTVAPTHKPDTIFHYDTSAAHVLCALVEKLTGKCMLDYVKEKALNYMDFSKDSYMIKDPFGVSMGGSGLMATPMDFLKLLYLIDKRGEIICNDGIKRTLLSKEFFDNATSSISDTIMTAPIPSEAQGYGMEIWQNEKGGYVLYGMGAQLGISIPDKKLLIVTTADTQGIAGGNQVIYDALYDLLLPEIDKESAIDHSQKDYNDLIKYADSLKIAFPRVPLDRFSKAPVDAQYNFTLESNPQRFTALHLSLSEKETSNLMLMHEGEVWNINFGMKDMVEGDFPKYGTHYTAGAIWLRENVLYIRVHLIGECVGSIKIELYFGDGDVTVFMKKVEETYFNEFNGHLYGLINK